MDKKKLGVENTYFEFEIPGDMENLKLPDPGLVMFYRNLDRRILWLDSEIDDHSIEYAKQIMEWNMEDGEISAEKRKPITILFFSPGGDLDMNNLLVDTIQLSDTPIIGVNCGVAASAACFIYLACHKRYTFPTAKFLIHQGSGEFSGTYDIVCAAITNYQAQIKRLGDFVIERTNIPEELFYANFSSDWYIDAQEAVEYGIAHGVIKSLSELFSMKGGAGPD